MNGIQIASLFARVGADTDAFERAMAGVDSRLGAVGGAFGKLGTAIKTGVTLAAGTAAAGVAALTATIAKSTSTAADMEQQVANIAAVMGLTAEQTDTLAGLINDLGLDPKLKVSAVEAGQAIEMLAKNGLNLDQIMGGAARATVFLANSTGAPFAEAADIGTSAMIQFGLKAEDMGAAVNQMVGVTNASKFGIIDYGYALAAAGGVAANVGVRFEDFNTVISAISPGFASGSDAGTSFKTFLQNMVPQTDKAAKLMGEIGLRAQDGSTAFYDAAGKMRDWGTIIGRLNTAFAGLSEEQKNYYAGEIFGTDASRAVLMLAKMTTDQYQEMKRVIGNTDAEKAAATRMDTLSSKWDIFQGILEATAIQIGQRFVPQLKRIMDWAANVATRMGPAVVEWFGRIADAFTWVTAALMEAFDAGGLDGVLFRLREWAGSVWQMIVNNAASWAGAFAGWARDLWTKTLAPWLAAAWSSFSTWLDEKTGGLVTKLGGWMEYLGALVGYVAGTLKQVYELGGWQAVVRQIVAWGGDIAGAFVGWASDLWTTLLQPKLLAVWGELSSWVTDANKRQLIVDKLLEWGGAFADWAGDIWKTHVEPGLTSFWNGLTSWVTDESKRNKLLGKLGEAWNWFVGWAGDLYGKVAPRLGSFFTGLLSWVVDPTKRAQLLGQLGDKWNQFATWAGGIWATISPKLTEMWDQKLKPWLDEHGNGLGTALESWGTKFSTFVGDAKKGWDEAWPAMQTTMTSAKDTIGEDIDRIIENLNEIAGWFNTTGTTTDWAGFWSGLVEDVAELAVGFTGMVANITEAIALLGQATEAFDRGDWGRLAEIGGRLTEIVMDDPVKDWQERRKNSGGFRAAGGPVRAGVAYTVGERGEETFVPETDGYILPHGAAVNGRIDLYVHGDSDLPASRAKVRELALALKRELDLTGAVMVR